MSKVIFLAETGSVHGASAVPAGVLPTQGQPLLDRRRRPLRDLRISVTDRCNFRCTYCMPREIFDGNYAFMPHSALLSFEEITRIAGIGASLGVEKIRLTGGEPLLRKNLEKLVEMLACLRTAQGKPLEIALTTNGTLLKKKAALLKDAGLARVTVSLDALDERLFERMSDSQVNVRTILEGLDEAARVGLAPVKVNMVVRKGVNEEQIIPMARHFRHSGHILRFIEFMDVGTTNGWNMSEVLTSAQILQKIQAEFPLEAIEAGYRGEVAARWRYVDNAGEIGVISSVSQPFCGDCTRARLSPEGKLFLCLFAGQGHDLRAIVRQGGSDQDVAARIAAIWAGRDDHYSELRGKQTAPLSKIEMSYIGG